MNKSKICGLFSLVITVFSAIFIFSACEIGLGKSIDKSDPKISVNYPPQNSIVRGAFILAGKCEDDQEIKSVKVKIRNADTNTEFGPFEAAIVNKKEWRLDINNTKGDYNGYAYGDGTYIFTIQATDTANKPSVEITWTLDIDNTPPVYVLQTPGVTVSSGNQPDAYGTVLSLNGQASDSHNTGIHIKFYDENGNYIPDADYTASNINVSGNQEIAKYAVSGTTGENLRYGKLYGTDLNGGEKTYSCSIEVFDNAREYKNPGDNGTGDGNRTTQVFLYDDVYTQFMSKTGIGLSASDFRQIINGTKTSKDVSKDQLVKFLTDTHSFEKGFSDNRLSFVLNPVSPPKYSIVEYSYIFEGSGETLIGSSEMLQAANSTIITATVRSGDDGTGIKKNGIQVWLNRFGATVTFDEVAEFYETIKTISTEYDTEIFKALHNLSDKNVEDLRAKKQEKLIEAYPSLISIYDGKYDTSSSSGKLSLTAALPTSGILGGKFYAIAITGFDEDGTLLCPEKGYFGFMGLATGEAPTIRISNPETAAIKKSSNFLFEGVASPNEEPLTDLKIVVSVTDELSGNLIGTLTGFKSDGRIQVVETGADELKTWNWTCNVNDLVPSSGELCFAPENSGRTYSYSAVVTVYENGKNASHERTVRIDSTKPQINLTQVSKIHSVETVYLEDGKTPDYTNIFINGDFQIQGNLVEQNPAGINWFIEVDGNTNGLAGVTNATGNISSEQRNIQVQLKTKEIASGNARKKLDVIFEARDKVGNEETVRLTDYLSSLYPANKYGTVNLVIDQTTDLPVITVANADCNVKNAASLAEGKNIFASKAPCFLNIVDDDAVAKVTISVLDTDGNEIPEIKDFVSTDVKTGALQYELPGTDGSYKLVIVAEDINKNTAKEEFFFGINSKIAVTDFALKVAADIFSSGDYVQAGKEIDVTGTITSGVSIVKVLKINPSTLEEESLLSNETGITTFTDKITVSGINDSLQTVVYKLVNEFGQKYETSFNYKIDTGTPSIVMTESNPLKIKGEKHNADKWYNDRDLNVEGFYNDSESGVKSIFYSVNNADWQSVDAVRYGSTNSYRFHLTASGFESGTNRLVLYAKDKCGNESEKTEFTIHCDFNGPEILSAKDSYFVTDDVAISGTIKDDVSGIEKIEISMDGGNTKVPASKISTVLSDDKLSGTWQLDISGLSLADNFVAKGYVYDAAGNSSVVNLFKGVVDKVNPEVFISKPVSDGEELNNIIVISGTASDNNSFELPSERTNANDKRSTVILEYSIDNQATWKTISPGKNKDGSDKTFFSELECYNWSCSFDLASTGVTETKNAVIRVTCYDAAGNSAVAKRNIIINPQSDYPVINLSNVDFMGDTAYCSLEYKMISGTITDDDGEIQKLWFAADETGESGVVPVYVAATKTWSDNGWIPVTVKNRSWSLTRDIEVLSDGNHTLYFYAVDGTGEKFSSIGKKIFFVYQNGTLNRDAGIKINFNTDAPEVDAVYTAVSNESLTAENFGKKNDITWHTDDSNFFAGGNSPYVYLKIEVTGSVVSDGLTLRTGSAIESEVLTGLYYPPSEQNYIYKQKGQTPVIKTASEYERLSQTQKNLYKSHSVCIAGPFDMSSYEGNTTFYVTAAGITKSGQNNTSVRVDNKGPKAEIISPLGNITSTASIQVKAEDADGIGTAKIEYIIPTGEQQLLEGGLAAISSGWKTVSESLSGEIQFSSIENTSPESLSYYTGTDSQGNNLYGNEIQKGLWEIPFGFRVTDKLGNIGYTMSSVKYDKESGIPTCTIKDPEADSYVTGVVKVTGSASCSKEVKEVHVQIDVNGDGEFTDADYNLINTWWKNNSSDSQSVFGSDIHAGSDSPYGWYIKAQGTKDWYLNINTAFLKNQGLDTVPASLSIRAIAFNNDDETKGFAQDKQDVRTVNITWDKPAIKELKLVQKNASGTIIISKDYADNIFIGSPLAGCSWYLEGICEDPGENTQFSLLTVYNTEPAGQINDAGEIDTSVNTTDLGDDRHYFSQRLSLNSVKTGIITASLEAVNNAVPTPVSSGTKDILIKVEQKKPVLAMNNEAVFLKANGRQLNTTDNTIQNSNSVFTMEHTVSEDSATESGVAFVTFWFTRNNSSENKTVLLDPVRESRKELKEKESADGSVYLNEDGIPVMLIKAVRPSSKEMKKITDEGIIATGNLLKIGGIYHKITAVDKSSGIVMFENEADVSFTDVEIVLAQTVNNNVSETPAFSGATVDYENIIGDDGDGLIETLSSVGGIYTWSSTFFSNKMSDGPVTVHVAVSDNVGNISEGTVQTKLENNRPRLAKILLGTDLDGNGKFDFRPSENYGNIIESDTANETVYGEFMHFSCLDADRNASYISVLNQKKAFNVKKRLVVIPDFAGGGNSKLSYTYGLSDSAVPYGLEKEQDKYSLFEMKPKASASVYFTGEISNYIDDKGFVVIENNISPAGIADTSDTQSRSSSLDCFSDESKVRNMGFTFWDSTEESEQGKNSQWTSVNFKVCVNTIDKKAPQSAINPFFWKGLNNNSIYQSNDPGVTRTAHLQGHIELEEDWANAPGYKSSDTSGIYDKDPKVSGKIVVTGEASDDTKIDSLWIYFDGLVLTSCVTDRDGVTVSKIIVPDGDNLLYYKAAAYNAGNWKIPDATMERDGWSFEITKNNLTHEGHSAEWRLCLDTEKLGLPGQSKADVELKVVALDGTGNSSQKNTDFSNRVTYRMDVVPYVTWIETNLSSKDELNPSIYSRSARGRYQVRGNKNKNANKSDSETGEDIVIHGFNLGAGVLTVDNEYEDGSGHVSFTTDKLSDGVSAVLPHRLNVGTMKSGKLFVSANGYTALNNVNGNLAKGTSESRGAENEYYYNMQANGENNNNLTDDLEIDVWEFKNGATKVSTELGNPTVRFNPNNGSIGMSFTNGIDFDMPGSSSDKDNGYKNMQYSHTYNMRGTNGFGDTTFAFDKNGYSYGAAQSRYDSGTVGNSGFFRLSLSRYLSGSYSTDNANYGQTGSVWLEANSINTKKFPKPNYSEWQNYQDRIVSPQIVAVAEDAESKKVMLHVAYADTATKQIRYRRSYVNAEIQYNETYYKNNAGIDYNQAHVLTFDPQARMDTAVPEYFRIIALPEGCTDESLIGKEVTLAELPFGASKNIHYVDVSTSRYLAGSSLRNVNDVDSNFQFGYFDLSEMKNDDDSFSDYRFPPKMWAVDFANNRIDQTTTANRTSYGNKPTYPYSTFSQAFAEYNPIMNPDSLQNQAGQTIHVLASSGIEGDVMDVYKKNTVKLTDSNGVTSYQKKKNSSYLYNAGNSVALGVADNGSPIIAWHDNERNRLNISFNTEAELKAAEDNVAAISKKNGGTGGTLYGKKGTYSGTPAYYVCYSYYANTSLTSYIRYYRLYNDGTKGKVEDRDENQFVDKAVYDGNSWSVNTANAYEKIPTGMYATPTASVKYKVMKLHSSKTRKWKYLTQTTTEVYNASGKLLSSKTEEIERKEDAVRTNYADIDALIFNNSNAIAKGGATVTEWELNGKVIYTPSNRVVQVYDDTTAPADTLKATREISRTTDPDTGNVTVVTQKDIDRDYYDIQSSVEWLTPDLDTKQYHAADKTNAYVSYPVYALYTKTDEFMGCATENTQLSFDRTEVWEGHTKQIGKGGAFVQMQVVDNIVHMAYYDEDTGSLNYTRIPFTGSSWGTAQTYVVDGYNDIGENLTLDIIKDEYGNHIPYIGYYGNKRAKLAYLVEPEAEKLSGSVSDKFTGVWEVLYVPSERSVNADRINVAVRKDADCKAIAGENSTDGATTANTSARYIYSNATTNPVMGYINANGNLELGQKR